ncbi:MAG: hypothetical protein HYT83_02465 [Candidatus Levybacteria bacterium]|nr:hypothetical protein [Candidatus Levybacteria bacterium]
MLTEARVLSMREVMQKPLDGRTGLFLATFTGIEHSQLAEMSEGQQRKVFLGLCKQLDLAVSLHGEDAKKALHTSVSDFFATDNSNISSLTAQVNSLLVFGNIRDLQGTGVEYLHDRLSHFWRILGWEELREINEKNGKVKQAVGSIEPVITSCGNLVRMLDLLAERWEEFGIGPTLLFPTDQAKISRESSNGFSASRLHGPHTNILAVVTGRNQTLPTAESAADYREKGLLLEQLLVRYPAEFAYVIFDYYIFAQGLDANAYNTAIMQEYVVNGTRKAKAMFNGKAVLLGGQATDGKVNHTILGYSNNDTATGAAISRYTVVDTKVGDSDIVTYMHGAVAAAVIGYPEVVSTFGGGLYEDPKKKVAQFAAAIDVAKYQKPILGMRAGKVTEYKPVEITEGDVLEVAQTISDYLAQTGVLSVNIEAGHIHADTTPTNRQRLGISIGAAISNHLESVDITADRIAMIDEDHVPNTLEHQQYVNLMAQKGYPVKEVVYESSPVTREIAIAAITSIAQKYPGCLHKEGDALIFDVPETDLQVELIKDLTEEPFELGCVIFDLGLTLYKIYPQLASLYSSQPGSAVHGEMLALYDRYQEADQRQKAAQAAFPPKTKMIEDLKKAAGLPELPSENAVIINILEGFYSPQQVKLQALLDALNLPVKVIGVEFSQQGLGLNLPKSI